MEASAAADDDSYFPIYISSDEEDERAYSAPSYSPEDIQIQEAILLSLDSSITPSSASSSASASAAAAVSSSRPAGVATVPEPPPDRKGKLSSEDGPRDSKKKRSKRNRFDCAICFERVQVSEMFLVTKCAHAFCNTCIGRYVAAKISENVAVIGCPDPGCEDVLGDEKLYCPFKDCSAVLINDGAVKIRETECPHCHRLFCARCRVPWHDGIKCKEFRKLGDDEKGEDDLTLKKLADKKKWQRCPRCKMYVSRRSGCLLMKCRCKQYFCYHCAAPMNKDTHYCNNCNH